MIGQCQQRHAHAEWLKFLRQIERSIPNDKALHRIADNYATHKHPVMKAWLDKHLRFHMLQTLTFASWLNMVELFFPRHHHRTPALRRVQWVPSLSM